MPTPGPVRRTVRFRITASATAAVVVVLAMVGVALILIQQRQLTESLDESLGGDAAELAAAVHDDGVADLRGPGGDDDAVSQVVASDGTVVWASDRLLGAPPLDAAPLARGSRTRTIDGVPDDDVEYRLVSRASSTSDGEPVVVHVASPLDDIRESTRVLATSLAVALPVVALLLAALVWWLVGQTLRPVEDIRAEVAGIGGAHLGRRVPEPGTGDEIDRLAHTMNDMLRRVEASSTRQQQFVADASHELRTPLTRLRAELEVDLAHPETADPAATLRSVLEEVDGLQHLVDDLLELARTHDAGSPLPHERVDLGAVVRREAERTPGGPVQIEQVETGAAPVRGDAAQLARAVRNLLDNAVRHARARVRVDLRREDGHVLLAVEDDGPGIPVEDRDRVFERFTRLDAARNGAAGGAGLGLAITRELVHRHGGTVEATDPGPAGGARFVVRLPAAPAGDDT